jgi:hypothetical protein
MVLDYTFVILVTENVVASRVINSKFAALIYVTDSAGQLSYTASCSKDK